jgi:hypothetical protein
MGSEGYESAIFVSLEPPLRALFCMLKAPLCGGGFNTQNKAGKGGSRDTKITLLLLSIARVNRA